MSFKPLKRKHTNKSASVKSFKHNASTTKSMNMAGPMRGGIRL